MDTLTSLQKSGRKPHLLLVGPTGSGKSYLAKWYADHCFEGRAHVLDAAFHNGVDMFRDTIKQLSKQKQELSLCIVENADMLTLNCQQALRRIMEQQAHVIRFAFCWYGHGVSDVLPAIVSRCVVVGVTESLPQTPL